jgi:hypothetical protein
MGLNKRITRVVIAISIILFAIVLFYLIFFYMPISLVFREPNLYSNNWSGYAVVSPSTTTTFNSISASWIVPEVASAPAPGYSSVWIGIGGSLEKSSRLIQAGTEQDVAGNGLKNYYAWFEALPRPTVNVGRVLPGDIINVRINRVDDSQSIWHVSLSRESKGIITTLVDNDVIIRINSASMGSAEFIVEVPAAVSGRTITQFLPLADFGTVTFTHCTTNLGGLGSLTNLYRFTMTSDGTKDGTALASPNALSDDGFNVNRLKLSQ